MYVKKMQKKINFFNLRSGHNPLILRIFVGSAANSRRYSPKKKAILTWRSLFLSLSLSLIYIWCVFNFFDFNSLTFDNLIAYDLILI